MEGSPLRLGILGLAGIAKKEIIPAAEKAAGIEITAVATRDGGKSGEARELTPEAELFADYGSLVEGDEVDAVYIPLPNSLHVEWTLKALEAGKHVLCEKPFSLDAAGAEKAVETARNNGLTLMEGFMFRLHPQTLRLRELLSDGAVGTVRQVVAQFGHRLDDPEDVRTIGSLGGGALGDVGCYAVSGVRLAFGGEPRRASAFGRFDEDDADRELAGLLEFDEGVGIVSCSLSSARRERLEIIGSEGKITLEAPFRADKTGGEMQVTRADETETESFEGGNPYTSELEEFAAAIQEEREPAVGPEEILGNARAIGGLLNSARQGGRVQGL
ncbi:MAG: Gfo/Idh/MocA family oxidoreductase [Rubrobacteraceae bacterium]